MGMLSRTDEMILPKSAAAGAKDCTNLPKTAWMC